MEVQVSIASLVVEGKAIRLTKSVAKQFPLCSGQERQRAGDKGEEAAEPIAKVMGQTLGAHCSWLYLVQDDEAGLAWQPANVVGPDYERRVVERGGWVDHPEEVPTIVL